LPSKAAAPPAPTLGPTAGPAARDPSARLLDEANALPIRGGVSYWGVSPPADCAVRSAGEGMLRFVCTVTLEALAAYFRYYYPTLGLTERPGGFELGQGGNVATGQAASLPEGRTAQLLLFRPLAGPDDPQAEALARRLSAPPSSP